MKSVRPTPRIAIDPEDLKAPSRPLGLATLLLLLGAGGAFLFATAGPPRLPSELPTAERILRTLQGYDFPLEALAYVAATCGWAFWGWIVATLVLRVLVVAAERAAQGAAWVRSFRTLSDWMTFPLVRRAVDTALATAVVVQVVGRAAPAAAAPLPNPEPITIVRYADAAGMMGVPRLPLPIVDGEATDAGVVEHTVREGDTLWSIAERYYGTGEEYPRLIAANLGRRMADGRTFDAHAVIYPSWVLKVPLPSKAVEERDGQRWYVVQEGDSLAGIAARLLGQEQRWTELFELNREEARLADGRVLTDPALIWEGLRLRLPSAPPSPVDLPPVEQPVVPPSATVPEPEPTEAPAAVVHSPAPVATAEPAPVVTAEPAPVEVPAVVVERAVEPAPESAQVPAGAVAAGLALLVGGAAVGAGRAVHGRRRPGTAAGPESDVELRGGFADSNLTREVVRTGQEDVDDPVSTLASQLLRFCETNGLPLPTILGARHGRSGTTLVLEGAAAELATLADAAPTFGRLLGAGVGVSWLADHDLELRVANVHAWQLGPRADTADDARWLVPWGVLADRQILSLSWRALGNVLVASLPGQGADVVLTSLVMGLAARHRPEELRLVAIASPRALPSHLADLPHLAGGVVDPADGAALGACLSDVRRELERRIASPEEDQPELVLLVAELDALGGHQDILEVLGRHGPRRGIRVLAGLQVDGRSSPPVAPFSARVVLRTPDEEASMALLGVPDAADLGGGGRFLVRVDGRQPIEACGFRIAPEHLVDVVQLMHRVYGAPTVERAPEPASAEDPVGAVPDTARLDEPAPDAADPRVEEPAPSETAGASLAPEMPVPDEQAAPTGPSSMVPEDDGAVEVAAECQPPRQRSPLIQVCCFGGPRVLVGEREVWPGSATSGAHKHWEVLVFLASQPNGIASKDRILGALWPEVEEEVAAGRLRTALYALRSALTEHVPDLPREIVRTDRDGTRRLDAGIIAADVPAFTAIVRRAATLPPAEAIAAFEEARALYGGDLLSQRSYGWLYERDDGVLTPQEQYRRLFRDATVRLAELYARQDQPALALALYRELLKLDPTDEQLVRAQFLCLRRLGDRTGLAKAERALRQELNASDDELAELWEPEPETVELFNHLMAELVAEAHAPAAA